MRILQRFGAAPNSAISQFVFFALFCFLVANTASPETPPVELQPSLRDFAGRVEVARGHIAQIVQCAEAAAARKIAHPEALLTIPYGRQASFAEELLNRSGGLAEALPLEDRPKLATTNDFVLFSLRSWETNGAAGIAYLNECRDKGLMTIVFASQAGRPKELAADFFIDNGAREGGESEAAVNTVANVLNAWLWVCEYTAALTRLGRHPGILQSITTAGSGLHNPRYQNMKTRHLNYPCEASLPAGYLASIYLQRVDRALVDLSGPIAQAQIANAAGLIAGRIKTGGKVFVSTSTHIMLNDMDKNNKTPWTALHTLYKMKKTLEKNTKPGDLFFWLGYNGVDVWSYPKADGIARLYLEYSKDLREAGVDLIACMATDPINPANNAPDALARIEQNWDFGDAEVPVPFPPGRMAPISGIYQAMLYRMLDDATAALLAK